MSEKINPVILCILDGVGINTDGDYNAVTLADTPNLDRIKKNNPTIEILTDGENVGLPAKQMGNSEVGHLNIGAGRVLLQKLPRINKSIENNEFQSISKISQAISLAKDKSSDIHIMGLLSDGGIHSHINHFIAAVKAFATAGTKVWLHIFTDGRDTPPQSSVGFIKKLTEAIDKYNNVSLATVTGRYYAMDRDKRWDRTRMAYEAIVLGKAPIFDTTELAVSNSYSQQSKNVATPSDEFIKPSTIKGYSGFSDNDMIFMINFRADRVRQLLSSISNPNFSEFQTSNGALPMLSLGMTKYSTELEPFVETVFEEQDIKNTLGEIVSKHSLQQLRVAETEKYPHVTFFFNGGNEEKFKGEDRLLIPSPKVATYDLQPEMSAPELTKELLTKINSKKYSLIIVNFANGDMVGHTGILKAAVAAVETLDHCITQVEKQALQCGYNMIIIADHGNCENMWDYKNNSPHTQHTTNPVNLTLVSNPNNQHEELKLKHITGKLADIAPTILQIMGLEVPIEMTGNILII